MYESYYQFKHRPFRVTPDPRFFFASASHSRGIAYCKYAFHQREGFVVITGSPGTGKTELMLSLINQLPKNKVTLARIVASKLNADDLLSLVATSFLPTDDTVNKGMLVKRLEDFFIAQAKIGRPVLLLIDDAHHLPVSSLVGLGMMCNFQIEEKPVLQCFLMGRHALKQKLDDPQLVHLKQRVVVSMQIETFTRQETQDYIRHRLQIAGGQNQLQFSDRAYSAIHHYSEGVPRRINALCHRILLKGSLEQKRDIDFRLVNKVIREMQDEAAVPSARMDLDFADIKSAAQQLVDGITHANMNHPPQQTPADIDTPLASANRANNVINLSDSGRRATESRTMVPDFTSPVLMYPEPETTTNDSNTVEVAPKPLEPVATQNNPDVDFNFNQDDKYHHRATGNQRNDTTNIQQHREQHKAAHHWGTPSWPGNDTIGSDTKATNDKQQNDAPSSPRRREPLSKHSGRGAANAVTRRKDNDDQSSIYQQASDIRRSGLLDKELLALASWYQPEASSPASNQPKKRQTVGSNDIKSNTKSPQPIDSHQPTKSPRRIESLQPTKSPQLTESPQPVTNSQAREDHKQSHEVLPPKKPKRRIIDDYAPMDDNIIPTTSSADEQSLQHRFSGIKTIGSPLSPTGLIISVLILAILWWFVYGPGVTTTLGMLKIFTDTVTDWFPATAGVAA